jgi:hypothetical protein
MKNLKSKNERLGLKGIAIAVLISTAVVFSMLPAISQAQVETESSVGKGDTTITKNDERSNVFEEVGKGEATLSKEIQNSKVVAVVGKGEVTLTKI